jgi:hypothetical protein
MIVDRSKSRTNTQLQADVVIVHAMTGSDVDKTGTRGSSDEVGVNDFVVFSRDDVDVLGVFQIRTRQVVDKDVDGGALWQMGLQRLDTVLCNNDLALHVIG